MKKLLIIGILLLLFSQVFALKIGEITTNEIKAINLARETLQPQNTKVFLQGKDMIWAFSYLAIQKQGEKYYVIQKNYVQTASLQSIIECILSLRPDCITSFVTPVKSNFLNQISLEKTRIDSLQKTLINPKASVKINPNDFKINDFER